MLAKSDYLNLCVLTFLMLFHFQSLMHLTLKTIPS